jgi:glycolate oxidase
MPTGLSEMRDLLTGLDLVDDADVLASLSHDEAEWAPYGTAVAAVRPRTTDDVRRVVAACAQRGVPIVPAERAPGSPAGRTRWTAR